MTTNIRFRRSNASAYNDFAIETSIVNVDRGSETASAHLPELKRAAAVDDRELSGFEFRQPT